MRIFCRNGARVCAWVLVLCATAVATDAVWYQTISVTPIKKGTMKATFYYNTTNRFNILQVPVSFGINDFKYVFNQTNDISDTFYWKKEGNRYKYVYFVDAFGRVKMEVDVKMQRGTLSLTSVNLEAFAVTNKTGYHTARLNIGSLDISLDPWFAGFRHQGAMRYSTNLFWMRNFSLMFNKGTSDQLTVRGVARYNGYTNATIPATMPVTLVVRGEGVNTTLPEITSTGTAIWKNRGVYNVSGEMEGQLNFNNGNFWLKRKSPFSAAANYQTNCNIFVTLRIGEPVVFEHTIAARAKSIQNNKITY